VAWRDWKTGERGTEREKSLSDEAMLGGVVEGCEGQLILEDFSKGGEYTSRGFGCVWNKKRKE
jgi:hypothetical protein